MGLMEAEAPFFGPNSDDVLEKNMIVNVDVSFFGHPTLNGLRVETCYVITENGAEPLCPEFEKELFEYLLPGHKNAPNPNCISILTKRCPIVRTVPACAPVRGQKVYSE